MPLGQRQGHSKKSHPAWLDHRIISVYVKILKLFVKNVGNYGEVFERNVGQDSRLKIARGLNQLWTKGGLQYAPPVR